MKANIEKQTTQRRIMQQRIHKLSDFNEIPPPSGWVKAIRKSLGLSIRQLAARIGVGHGSLNQLEKREPTGKVTLESLERAARAMDCKVVYAIIPIDEGFTLDTIIESRAKAAARKIMREVSHSMLLEGQGTSKKQLKEEIMRVAKMLIESGDPRIWDTDELPSSEKKNG